VTDTWLWHPEDRGSLHIPTYAFRDSNFFLVQSGLTFHLYEYDPTGHGLTDHGAFTWTPSHAVGGTLQSPTAILSDTLAAFNLASLTNGYSFVVFVQRSGASLSFTEIVLTTALATQKYYDVALRFDDTHVVFSERNTGGATPTTSVTRVAVYNTGGLTSTTDVSKSPVGLNSLRWAAWGENRIIAPYGDAGGGNPNDPTDLAVIEWSSPTATAVQSLVSWPISGTPADNFFVWGPDLDNSTIVLVTADNGTSPFGVQTLTNPSTCSPGPQLAIGTPLAEVQAIDRPNNHFLIESIGGHQFLYTLAYAPYIIPLDGGQPITGDPPSGSISGSPAPHAFAILDAGSGSFLFFYDVISGSPSTVHAWLEMIASSQGWHLGRIGVGA
jgi:hypothetical protein